MFTFSFPSFKLFIQFSFFKIVILWAKSVQYAIGCLWQWAAEHHKQMQDDIAQSLIEEGRRRNIDSFIKSMQRQAKITGARSQKNFDS